MENSNTTIPKPLRARKTMTPSSRKQVEMLNKIKNISGQEKIIYGLHTEDHHVQLNTVEINYRTHDSIKESSLTESKTDKPPEKSEVLPQKLTASVEGFSVNSKVNEEVNQCSYDKNFAQNCPEESQESPHEKSCNKNSDAKQFLNAGCLQDILHKWYEKELTISCSKPVEVHLYSKPNNLPVHQLTDNACLEDSVSSDHGDEKTTDMKIAITKERNDAIEEVIPAFEKVEIMSDSNDVKHVYNLAHSVTPTLSGTDRIADGFDSQTANGNGGPNTSTDMEAPVMLQDASPEYNIEQTINIALTEEVWMFDSTLSLIIFSLLSMSNKAQRKRFCSEGKDDIDCKRIKTSEENGESVCTVSEKEEFFWGKVKCLIQKQMAILNNDVFNRKLESLNGRVEQTQCRNKHEEIAITFLKKVSKLERRINTVIAFQKKISKMIISKSSLPGADSRNAILNRIKSAPLLPDNVNGQSVSSVKPLSSSHRQTGSASECVAEENVSSDEVILISVESRNSATVTTASNSGVHKKIVCTQAEISTKPLSKNKHSEEKTKSAVIDLTEEEKHNFNKGKVKEHQYSASKKGNSEPGSPKSDCHEPPAQASAKVLEHLPEVPRIPPYPELKDRYKDTVPPQKPELKLAQVQNPKGIALSWTVTEIDPKCAPVESYHLFLYHEHPHNSSASHWKKIGEIKALPLPMACSLSQFTASKKYYFTIQSKDVCGRYGPFCDIQSIVVL